MILIYLPTITNRARYIFRLCFNDLIGSDFTLTESKEEFLSFQGPRINYSEEFIENVIRFRPDPLLFNKSMINFPVAVAEYENVPVLFPDRDPGSSLPFDPFAAGFYMVSRYEEYASFKGDRFGRYKPEDSVAFKGSFLRRPVVNLWAGMIRDLLQRRYPGLTFRKKQYRFIPTIDIDHAYAFGHRNFTRNLGGFSRDIGRGDFRNLWLRTLVTLGRLKDPYDTYQLLGQIHEKYGVRPVWFVLFADYGRHDNNVSLKNKSFKSLVRELSRKGEMGIHPSLASNRDISLLRREILRMSHVIDGRIINSRQHFLKFSFPRTFRYLLKFEIQNDFSMGYASEPGFRAGIADPFRFFDLSQDIETELIIHPVTLMDVSLRDYLRLDIGEATELIREMTGTVKAVNGQFVSLWHNESLSDMGRWKGWRKVYEEMVSLAAV